MRAFNRKGLFRDSRKSVSEKVMFELRQGERDISEERWKGGVFWGGGNSGVKALRRKEGVDRWQGGWGTVTGPGVFTEPGKSAGKLPLDACTCRRAV